MIPAKAVAETVGGADEAGRPDEAVPMDGCNPRLARRRDKPSGHRPRRGSNPHGRTREAAAHAAKPAAASTTETARPGRRLDRAEYQRKTKYQNRAGNQRTRDHHATPRCPAASRRD